MRDLARLYERMVMRRHTNGGYQNVVDELWRQCEDWNAKLIIMYQNVACKNMATVQGILDDQGRERGYDLIWVEHDLDAVHRLADRVAGLNGRILFDDKPDILRDADRLLQLFSHRRKSVQAVVRRAA